MKDRITVRMTDEMIARIDAWIAGEAGYVSRQEAVRRLIELSLDHIDRRVLPGVAHQANDAGTANAGGSVERD